MPSSCAHRSWLQEELHTVRNLTQAAGRERPDLFPYIHLIDRKYLRNIDDATPRKICFAFGQGDIPRRSSAFEVRGQGADNDRADATSIEKIVLHDDMRVAIAGS